MRKKSELVLRTHFGSVLLHRDEVSLLLQRVRVFLGCKIALRDVVAVVEEDLLQFHAGFPVVVLDQKDLCACELTLNFKILKHKIKTRLVVLVQVVNILQRNNVSKLRAKVVRGDDYQISEKAQSSIL